MAAVDPCKGLLSKYPAGSPERQAQIDACFAQKRAQKLKSGARAKPMKPTSTTKPEGKGAPGEQVWGTLHKLVKDGLPG